MNRGQKPTPTNIKLVTGNPGKRPLPESEPTPEGEVKKPAFVKNAAARIWAKYAPSLEKQGVLTAWDVDMFGAFCHMMADYQAAPSKFTAAQMTQMRALAACFGLLPAERSRLKIGKKEERQDPAAEFFA